MPFEFYSDQPSTTGGALERVLIKNDTSSTINLLTTDNDGNILHKIPISAGGSTLHRTISGNPNAIERLNGDRFWFYNSEKGTIVVSDLGKGFAPYNEEKDKDAFLFDFEKDPDYEPPEPPDIYSFAPEVTEEFKSDSNLEGLFSTYFGYGVPDAAKALGITKTGNKFVESSKNNHQALNYLSIKDAWDAGYTGKGVKIAVLDSGFHENVEFTYTDKWNLVDGDDILPLPESETHGNLVASVIFSRFDSAKYKDGVAIEHDTTGVAPDAELFAFATSNASGGTDVTVADGIRLAVERGANIVHVSQGRLDTAPPIVQSAVDYAYENNVLVVFAGGNNSNFGPANLASTALSGKAIGVGNLRLDVVEPFKSSNLAGDKPFPYFFAPSSGTYIREGNSYLTSFDAGTSTASPYITGIAALLYQQNPNITVDEVIEKLALSSWQPSLGKSANYNEFRQQTLSLETVDSASSVLTFTDILQINTTKNDTVSSTISRSSGLTTVDGKSISLVDVERLQFIDAKIAFDTDGKAGDALQLLYAVSKDQYLNNDGIKGLAIELIDKSADRDEIVDYVMGELAGPSWNLNDMTKILARNIYGIDVTGAIDNLITDLMQANQWDNYDFFWAVAESETASSAIGLVGLSDSGITYS